jgi:hypothetical protein
MPPRRSKSTKTRRLNETIDYSVAEGFLRKLNNGESLSEQERLQVLLGSNTTCSATCKSKQEKNPNCLCCLIPAPNSYKKTGLWQKDTAVATSMGPDPADEKREVALPLPNSAMRMIDGCTR